MESQVPGGAQAEVRLLLPDGWSVPNVRQTVEFSREGEKASVHFQAAIPETSGDFEVGAVARIEGREYGLGYQTVAYPHIERRHVYAASRSRVKVFDVRTESRNIGYVEGAGDRIAESLRQLGLDVSLLGPEVLARGDLSVYDTIVLGIRAYAVRDDLRAFNNRLLEYVKDGGTLLVQYNTYEILDSQFGPYPFSIRRPHDRVTVEDAPIVILEPFSSRPERS